MSGRPKWSEWLHGIIMCSFLSSSTSFSNGHKPAPHHTLSLSPTRLCLDSSSTAHEEENVMEQFDENEAWDFSLALESKPYVSSIVSAQPEWRAFLETLTQLHSSDSASQPVMDALWEHIKLEATNALRPEPQAGPQLFGGILSQPSLMEAIVTVVSHEIETELMPATALKNLFLEQLTPQDEISIHFDIMATVMRSPSVGNAMTAMLFHQGIHALVCYRLGHRLWEQGRTALAYYMQSTVSRKYSADIHPASKLGSGIYLNTGGGVVIGETAVVGQDVTILQGVTLGGTGKEAGDRHPKVGDGVILHDSATVLGNIPVGEGAVITAKSIVTKPVPPLALVSGVPAKIHSYRELTKEEFESDELQQSLSFKYMQKWQEMATDTVL